MSSQRLIELDVLRVVAILFIVFNHEVDVGLTDTPRSMQRGIIKWRLFRHKSSFVKQSQVENDRADNAQFHHILVLEWISEESLYAVSTL